MKNNILYQSMKNKCIYSLEDLREYFDRIGNELKQMPQNNIRIPKIDIEDEKLSNLYSTLESYRIEDVFLKTFRHSMIVTLFTHFENALDKLCNYCHIVGNLGIPIENEQRNKIEICKKYISRHYESIAPVFRRNSWLIIQDFKRIRDCIVHTDGNVLKLNDKKKKILIKIIEKNGLVLNKDQQLIIEDNYITSSLENIRTFLEEIFDSINQKIESRP